MSRLCPGRLTGEVALVTLGERGLGRSIADGLAAEGAAVAALGVSGCTDDDAVGAAVARVVRELGVPTVLVTTGAVDEALLLRDGNVFDLTLDAWRANRGLALDSAFLHARHVLPLMARARRGSVVHVVPSEAVRGTPGMDCRATAGGALVGLTRAQANFWQRYGLRVNCVAAGFVENSEPEVRAILDDEVAGAAVRGHHPFGLIEPDQVAATVCHLASAGAEGTSGAVVPVDRGALAFSHLAHQIADLPDLPSGITVDGSQKARIRARAEEYAAAGMKAPPPLGGWAPVARKLEGQVILVTGSTHGIGRAMVETFAAFGAAVVVSGRSRDAGEEIAETIRSRGEQAMYVATDVSREEDVANAVAVAVSRFGRLTGMVNNAAIIGGGGGLDGVTSAITADAWRKLLSVNLDGIFLGCRHAAPHIALAGGGCMINVASAAGAHGHPGSDAYAAAKAGLLAFTRSAGAGLWRYRVRVNALVVGTIDTGEPSIRAMLDDPFGDVIREFYSGAAGRPLDIALTAAHLLSSEAGFTTAGTIPVENGATAVSHLPWFQADLDGLAPSHPGGIEVLQRIRSRL